MSLDDFDSEEVPQKVVKLERDDIPVVDKIDIGKEEFIQLNKDHSEAWIRDWIVHGFAN